MTPPQPDRFWTSSRIVVWLFMLQVMILNVVAINMTVAWDIDWEYSIPGTIGIICGEVCVVVLVSGLTGQTWLTGYFRGLSMMILGYLAIVGGLVIDDLEHLHLEPLSIVAVLPWILLVCTSPLLALRQLGWRLIHKNSVPPPSFPFRIADLLHGTAMVASALALVRVPEVIEELHPRDFWMPLLIASGILFTMCLIAVPIAVRLGFGTASRRKSRIGLGLLAATAYFVIVLVMQCFYDLNTTWVTRVEVLQPVAILVGATVAILYPFIHFFSLGGMVLVRQRRGQATNATGDSNQAVDSAKELSMPRSRWKVAAFVGTAILTNIALAQLQAWRRARDREIAELTATAASVNSRIAAYGREILTIELNQPATDSHLEQCVSRRSCAPLKYLHLNSPKLTNRVLEAAARFSNLDTIRIHSSGITDDGLAYVSKLKNLTVFEINGAAISDRGLVHLSGLGLLTTLNLTGTSVTATGLAPIADSSPIASLTLDNTSFGDADCVALARMTNLQTLSMKRTAVTDVGLQQLSNLRLLRTIDLSDTAVTGTGLSGCREVTSLDLDNTQVNDESLRTLATLTKLTLLNLSGTEITDQSLEDLAPLQELSRLDISNTRVTDQGVARLAGSLHVQSMTIDLSRNPITGECFRNWPPSPNMYLVLGETQINDSTLPLIAKTTLHGLDVSGTKTTCKGLIAAGFTGLQVLRIGKGQFTSAEIKLLETRLATTVEFDESEIP